MDYKVLVPHIGDRESLYNIGDTRTIDNAAWAAELVKNGVVELIEKPTVDEKPTAAKKGK